MPVQGNPDSLLLGRACSSPEELGDLKASLSKASSEEKYDFLVIPLAAPGGQGEGADLQPSVDSDLIMSSKYWNSCIVGAVSSGLDPDAASNEVEARKSSECLATEVRWAVHLGLRGILLPSPTRLDKKCGRYARAVNELLLSGIIEAEGMALTMRCPSSNVGWSAWNSFRTLCDHHAKLHVALELEKIVKKPEDSFEKELERWIGEPVRYIIIHRDVFITNNKGYPVLPKHYKNIVSQFFRHEVKIILDEPDQTTFAQRDFVARLFQGLPPLTQAEEFAHSHRDTLQAPLQPLADNLESETYELFEQDPVKYALYEEAVFRFLTKRKGEGRQQPFYIVVVGAGRGPLVAASLRAASRADVLVHLWAVEKNPNAIHTLRHRKRKEANWRNVEIVAQDMRVWEAPQKADVLVSELLGSWGDNELSPECLDGAQRFLKEDGVSIPQSYVSFVTPVSTTKLWDDVRITDKLESIETAYVVNFHQAFFPCSTIQECFTFNHPNSEMQSNDRYTETSFQVEVDALVHGFAGYFDCELFDGVRMSIHPETYSKGMFSWFPMYFPLKTPVLMRKGETICSHWWRRHAMSKVWYEWSLSEPVPSPIQNPGGRSWTMGM